MVFRILEKTEVGICALFLGYMSIKKVLMYNKREVVKKISISGTHITHKTFNEFDISKVIAKFCNLTNGSIEQRKSTFTVSTENG